MLVRPAAGLPAGADAPPRLTLQCLGPGTDVALGRLTGRPTLVDLWATWCGPCREEMPMLQEAYARHGERVRFPGVDVQDEPEAARWFLDEHAIGYPHALDADGELLRRLGIRGLPVTVALDADRPRGPMRRSPRWAVPRPPARPWSIVERPEMGGRKEASWTGHADLGGSAVARCSA